MFVLSVVLDLQSSSVKCHDFKSFYLLNLGYKPRRTGEDLDDSETVSGTVNGNLSVFPNPSNGEFFIDVMNETKYSGDAKVEFINSLGQHLLTDIVQVENGHLVDYASLGEYSSGVYLVKVTIENNEYTARLNLVK